LTKNKLPYILFFNTPAATKAGVYQHNKGRNNEFQRLLLSVKN
jgi:hypothetical protein